MAETRLYPFRPLLARTVRNLVELRTVGVSRSRFSAALRGGL
jgi:hypothetical protein